MENLATGYYKFGNKIYLSRQDMLDDAMLLLSKNYSLPLMQFIFNEEVFDKIDWTIEPSFSLKELYTQRAQQLRDDYDYLILSYSGGSDSHEILGTFLENNIFIDEIQVMHYEKAMSRFDRSVLDRKSVV